METPERPERSLPSPWTQATPPAPYKAPPAWEEVPDPEAPAARRLTPRTVLRALRRHWWQALLLWGVLSSALVTLAYLKIQPTYEATAWLKVEPTERTPLSTAAGPNDLRLFMETQVRLVTAPDVLGRVIHNPQVASTALIGQSRDPEAELKNRLRVLIPPGTSLILISMSSTRPNEAEVIVNAVADAYLDSSKNWMDDETRQQITQLRKYKDRFYNETQRLRGELVQLADKGTQADPQNSPQEKLNTYRSYRQRLDTVELEIMDAEATIRTLSAMRERAGPVDPEAQAPAAPSAAQLDQLVEQAFLADPQVSSLYAQVTEAKRRLGDAQRITARHDPAVTKFRRDYDALKRQYDQLWAQMRPELRRQLAMAPPEQPVDPVTSQLETGRIRLEKLTAEKAELTEALSTIKIEQQAEGNDAIRAQFADEDLAYYNQMYQKVSLALEDAEYQQHGPAKITSIQRARPAMEPSDKKRLAMMAGAPVGVFGLVLALVTLLEVRGARVADPDELSSRLRLGVIGVVPPLPSLAPPKGPKALRDQRRRLEEFVQSLDHLRVTLCAPTAAVDGAARRCVMITSAVGGEGKTTLAAQLAGRCANAGLTTLLVDADMRRPSLGELLEVPEGPGLAEILAGEAQPEEAMVVIGNAGGFHLLPAGSGGHDPSRLLQGERLGQLIARLREAFDVVLIDAPPVLPVPDALLVGRWTDGAVVAVRHDSSRFPLVERAQKRLTSIGVPLLGAVVNGVRPAESNYGAYDYYATAGGRTADREDGA